MMNSGSHGALILCRKNLSRHMSCQEDRHKLTATPLVSQTLNNPPSSLRQPHPFARRP